MRDEADYVEERLAFHVLQGVPRVVLRSGAYVLSDGRALPPRSGHPGCSPAIAEGALALNHCMLKSREEFRRKQARWGWQDPTGRMKDDYFAGRDAAISANPVRDTRLVELAPRIVALVDAAKRDGGYAGAA